jgi:hypothetical protein
MNIDIRKEQLIPLRDAPALLPRVRRGRKIHAATIYRWVRHGRRGRQLEALQCGGTLCTSVEALQRFFTALTEPDAAPCVRASVRSAEHAERTARELDKAGL